MVYPPYSKNVKTKVAETFRKLIAKHFTPRHKFKKLFNKNNLKVSYSCTPSMNSIINGHNRKVIHETTENNEPTCNCGNTENCPLKGNCLARESLYEATITSDLPRYQKKVYKRVSEPPFKTRFRNHEKAFNNLRYKNDSKLSVVCKGGF